MYWTMKTFSFVNKLSYIMLSQYNCVFIYFIFSPTVVLIKPSVYFQSITYQELALKMLPNTLLISSHIMVKRNYNMNL